MWRRANGRDILNERHWSAHTGPVAFTTHARRVTVIAVASPVLLANGRALAQAIARAHPS